MAQEGIDQTPHPRGDMNQGQQTFTRFFGSQSLLQ